nr:uncharacterized protein LOC104092460 [Nicotiana tomentosiformis]
MKDDVDSNRRGSRGRFLPYEQTQGNGRSLRSVDKFISDIRTDRGRNNRLLQDRETPGLQGPPYPKLSEYNFNISVVELVSAMKNIKEVRFPRPMRSNPSQRDPNLWCEYHDTNGHRTEDCRHFREEVATLLKNGHLREFLSDRAKNNYGWDRDDTQTSRAREPPRQMINMIFGGNEVNRFTFSAAKKTRVSTTHNKRFGEDDITFTDEDVDGLLQPHNDALHRPNNKALAGFNLASKTTRGEILLLTVTEGVTKTTLFEVADEDMGYNIILGRPWLHEMKVVPSTYHQLLKFPKPEGIKWIRGDQPAAREMNSISVSHSRGKEPAA